MPRHRAPPPQWFEHKYGLLLPQQLTDFQLEGHCFKISHPEERGGLGKYGHARQLAEMLWPDLQWNPWLERMWRGFTQEKFAWRLGDTIVRVVSMAGAAGCGKTFASGRYAFLWWLVAPQESIVILTTTTKGAIGQRVWPVIQSSFYEGRKSLARLHGCGEDAVNMGNLVDSRKVLQCRKGDEKHAIFAQAVKEGETAKAEAFIRGQHAPRMLIVIDEGGETPEAIYSAAANLRKACQDLTIIVIDNPASQLNAHGRVCMPKGGWGNRPPVELEWPTEGVPEWQIEGGLCMLFKGADSPNVRAGRTLYKHIYTFEDFQASQREGVKNTLTYWKYDAGDWPPDGVCKTVFNSTMAVSCGMQKTVNWLSTPVPVSFLDPGFGGDACIQMIGLLGDVALEKQSQGAFADNVKTKKVLQVKATIDLVLEPNLLDETGKRIDYEHQIANQVRENCRRFNVLPQNFGCFCTGTGRGVASILHTDWSGDIFQVEEGGTPSENLLSAADNKPAKDICDRRVTELWFSARAFADSAQVCGLDNLTLAELCAREYKTAGKPWKYCIETKEEFRPKLGHSCDRADAFVGMCELVKVRHGVLGGGAKDGPKAETLELPPPSPYVGSYTAENEREMVASVGRWP